MKKIITLLAVFTLQIVSAQVFTGKGDLKFQLGANIQDGGTGMVGTVDFGMGQNISFGVVTSYMLNANAIYGADAKFEDRVDLRARFNANIGDVLGAEDILDVYPGVSLGLRNLGGHVGVRYFFTEGFGVFSEIGAPIATYKSDPVYFEKYNNQFYFNIGASFSL